MRSAASPANRTSASTAARASAPAAQAAANPERWARRASASSGDPDPHIARRRLGDMGTGAHAAGADGEKERRTDGASAGKHG